MDNAKMRTGSIDLMCTYERNIRDWKTKIEYKSDAVPQLTELISYNTPNSAVPGQFTGNVSTVDDFFHSSGHVFSSGYSYDGVNRLREVSNFNSLDEMIESFEYDGKGRLIAKYEGGKGGEYVYAANKNRLESIVDIATFSSFGRQSTANGHSNFIYDPNGNMVLDRSKKMAIRYDWRNMPIAFDIFSEIPDQVLDWKDALDLKGKFGIMPVNRIAMLYDSNGKRVMKSRLGNGE